MAAAAAAAAAAADGPMRHASSPTRGLTRLPFFIAHPKTSQRRRKMLRHSTFLLSSLSQHSDSESFNL